MAMTTTQATNSPADQTRDRDSELERAITDALVLAVGKRAANRALRHARARTHRGGQRSFRHVAGHMAGYGALLAYAWHQRRTANQSVA